MIIGTIESGFRLHVNGKPGLTHPLRGPGANAVRFRADIGTMKPEYVGRRILTKPCGTWAIEPRFRLWAWSTERKATRAHIRHFIGAALQDKAWAATMPANWNASKMSCDHLDEIRLYSVRQLARKALEYARHRAFMPGAYAGYPGDRPARDLWEALRNGTPARYYDSVAREYVERIGGAAL